MSFSFEKIETFKGEKARKFIFYFESLLSSEFLQLQFSSIFNKESLEITFNCRTKSPENFEFKWIIIRSVSGDILSFKIDCNTIEIPNGFELLIANFINKVLSQCISNENKLYCIRNIIFYEGFPLDGEYWLDNKSRISPAFDDKFLEFTHTERVLVFDQEVDALNLDNATEIAGLKMINVMAYLSFIFDQNYFSRWRGYTWKYPLDDGEKNTRVMHGYKMETPIISSLPSKGSEFRLGKVEGSLLDERGSSRYMCNEFRKIYRIINDTKILNSMKCYQMYTRLKNDFPTASIAYLVSAIDSLTQVENNSKVSFINFLKEFLDDYDQYAVLLSAVYGEIRSAHFHSGSTVLDAYSFGRNIVSDPEIISVYNRYYELKDLLRRALINFYLRHSDNKN